MRVFLDTNVLVSAFAARGLCADLFRYLLAEHQILTGEVNLTELQRVLRDNFDATPGQIAVVVNQIRDQVVVRKATDRPSVRVRDEADEWVLASAMAGEADLLISGDKDLLAIAGRISLPILTPRQAWEYLRGGEPDTA